MGLFGSSRRKQDVAPADAVAAKETPRTQARRRGLFGRVMMNDGDQTTPNLVDYAMYGPHTGDVMRRRRNSDFAYGAAQEELGNTREDRTAATQTRTQSRALAQQYILTLPPEQQQQAMLQFTLDPDGFAERIQGAQFEARPGMTHATAVDPYSGAVRQGGALPLRPRAPLIQYGASDDGYDYEDEQ